MTLQSCAGGSDNNPFPWLMAAGCAAHSIVHPPKILADEITTTVDQTWETIGPFVTKMGFSGLIGLAAAGVLKVSKPFPTSAPGLSGKSIPGDNPNVLRV